jgi:hypothetical protein
MSRMIWQVWAYRPNLIAVARLGENGIAAA